MNILIASPIDPEAIETLERSHDVVRAFSAREEVLCDVVQDREILVFRSGVTITPLVMGSGENLRLLIRAGSGLDNVDVDHARKQGLRLVRIPGSSAQVVAEFTFALMLDVARKVSHADRLLRQGHWPKSQLLGHLLAGKTLGVVGTGNIGTRVGELGAAWGMNVLGCVKSPSDDLAAKLREKGITLTDFETVLESADFLTVHVPLDDSTYHMIDARAVSRMKDGAFLVNLARGGVVDEEALFHELTEGLRLGGAALDVHEKEGEGTISPFSDLPNVVLTPHIGAMAGDSQREIGNRLLTLVDSYIAGEIDAAARDGELVI
jgi:D-3-phosphoglycerate dehydrogenase / 2-oxoglutarate reductase